MLIYGPTGHAASVGQRLLIALFGEKHLSIYVALVFVIEWALERQLLLQREKVEAKVKQLMFAYDLYRKPIELLVIRDS